MNLNWLHLIKNKFRRKALVLMYHRIADIPLDPWQIAVSPENFEQHLQVLQSKYSVIPISHLVSQLQGKFNIPKNSVCLTFDDGYSDNYLYAKPLLEKYQCPATFFIPNKYIDQKQLIGSDELLPILLSSITLPATLSVYINQELFFFELGTDSSLTDEQRRKQNVWIGTEKPPNKRCELYLTLRERLKPLTYEALQSALKEVRSWAGLPDTALLSDVSFPMTTEQLKALAYHPLFDLGLHTDTHPNLPYHHKEIQLKEIASNQAWLSNICNRQINTLAYPYGDYSEVTLLVVKNLKLDAAFTTEEGTIDSNSNPHTLNRFQVNNWSGEEFERHLSDWRNNR